jgi:hypothetical protein
MKTGHVASCLLGLMLAATRADASQLYGSVSSGQPGKLWIINAANGAAIQDVGALIDSNFQNYSMTGLAQDPFTGVLYGSTGMISGQTLVRIDPKTAQVTVVGPFNAFVASQNKFTTMADIDFSPSGQMYGIASVGNPNLYSIDKTTGQATLIGNSGQSFLTAGGGLGISPDGTFYATPETSHYGTYDSTTGAYTNITNPARPAGSGASYAALAYDGNTLYGMNLGIPTHLVIFDNPATGHVTDLGPSVDRIDGIAFVNAFWALDSDGSWSTGTNWTSDLPNAIGASANFGAIITSSRTVTVDAPQTVGSINFFSPISYVISGSNAITMNVSSGSASLNVIAGSHTISAPLTLNSDLVVNSSSGTGIAVTGIFTATGKNITKAGAGTVQFENVRASSLTVNAGKVQISSKASPNSAPGTSVVQSLSIGSGAALDVANNAMIIDYSGSSPINAIQGYISSGYNGGDWAGNGVTSSSAAAAAASAHRTALGYAEASSLGIGTFAGQVVDASAICIRYTYSADANLDGTVDTLDFNSLAANFGGTGKVWSQADFNFDGKVDTLDFNALATNFGQSLPIQVGGSTVATVPEPAMIAMTATLGGLCVVRRWRPLSHKRLSHAVTPAPR